LYYVVLSAWDSNGSYDQLGLSNYYGSWGLLYSWTTGPLSNLYYNTYPDEIALSMGVTYTFNITAYYSFTIFTAYQGSTLIWSKWVQTGGYYLILSNGYGGVANAGYTDYEEMWYAHTNGGAPGFNFYFHDQSWVAINGSSYAATWTSFYQPDPDPVPPFVNVAINGDSVLVMNMGVDIPVISFEPIPPHYPVFQVYHHGMRLNGQSISMNYTVTVNRTDNDASVLLLDVEVGLNRTNVNNASDYRNIGTTNIFLLPGQNCTCPFVWNETDTLNPGNYSITGYANSLNNETWEMNPADTQLTNDTVQAEELVGDLNGDGVVDVFDAVLFAKAFNSKPGDPNWNPDADLNNDGVVDMFDATIFASHFGQSIGNGTGGVGSSGSPNGTVQPTTAGTPSVVVDPSQTTVFKGEAFTVNVDVTSVTDLQGWECQLYWNSAVLNCTNVAIQTPTEWQNNTLNFGAGLQANYNATCARYWQAQAATYQASSFNGSMTIVTLTFQALQPGTTALTLADVKLGNSTAQSIAYTASSGSVSVYYGRYMRSDTQTVNGLAAYVLNIPESTSSASSTQVASGRGASWGIRAFVRHSNGVEQEISLDGQTGTPKAVVSAVNGMGILSATVSVGQMALQPTDSLVVRVYVQVGNSAWTLCATFTTEQLQASTLNGTTWTVYYYTLAGYNVRSNITSATLYWGTTTYDTRIQNLQYA
jgi:hypothetical protein